MNKIASKRGVGWMAIIGSSALLLAQLVILPAALAEGEECCTNPPDCPQLEVCCDSDEECEDCESYTEGSGSACIHYCDRTDEEEPHGDCADTTSIPCCLGEN